MPILVQLLRRPLPQGIPEPAEVVQADIPAIDGCQVLTRTKAFLVPQGTTPTLEHTFRDRQGRPLDLSAYLDGPGDLISASSQDAGSAALRIKEWLSHGLDPERNPVWEVVAHPRDVSRGILRATLPSTVTLKCGIYRLSWGVRNAVGQVVAVNEGILSVERSLFVDDSDTLARDLGPPTINEIRMEIMDSSGAENVLLDDIEFADEQILDAIVKPVQLWNESPPPVAEFTTRTFPFRDMWKKGIVAQLLITAAHNYRRNRLLHSAGGVTVDDKNKEKEYLQTGLQMMQDFKTWLLNKKVSINAALYVGNVGSVYGRRGLIW